MRFSLATLVLLMLWIGALMAVWVRREPWVEIGTRVSAIRNENRLYGNWFAQAPDHRRNTTCNQQEDATVAIVDVVNHMPLCIISNSREIDQSPIRFLDNDTLELARHSVVADGPEIIVSYHRRFPEWWWGHFYRPEVWLAIAMSGVLIWRGVCARRRQKIST